MATEAEVRAAYTKELGRAPAQEALDYWMGDSSGFGQGAFNDAASLEIAARPAPLYSPEQTKINQDWADFQALTPQQQQQQNIDYAAANNLQLPTPVQAEEAGLDIDEGLTPPQLTTPQLTSPQPSLVNYGLDQIRPGSDYNTPATQSRDILSEMIDKNDPYMQSAVNYAQEAASGVGRVNSSYAAGAATRAAIDAAAPLAQQDALTAANFNINEQTASSGLVRDSVQNEYNINTASNLAEVNAASAAIADTSALVREQLVQDATMDRLNADNQNAIDAALLNADASATANFSTTYGSMSQQLTQGLSSIDAANMDAPDALAAKNDLIATFNHNVQGLLNITNAGLSQYQLTWEPNVSLEAGGFEVPLPETVDDVNTWNPTNENNR